MASGLAGQRGHVSLSCNDCNLVNSVQDQVEDAFLLKQILAIAQGSKFDLLLLVFCMETKNLRFVLSNWNGSVSPISSSG